MGLARPPTGSINRQSHPQGLVWPKETIPVQVVPQYYRRLLGNTVIYISVGRFLARDYRHRRVGCAKCKTLRFLTCFNFSSISSAVRGRRYVLRHTPRRDFFHHLTVEAIPPRWISSHQVKCHSGNSFSAQLSLMLATSRGRRLPPIR